VLPRTFDEAAWNRRALSPRESALVEAARKVKAASDRAHMSLPGRDAHIRMCIDDDLGPALTAYESPK